MPLRGDRQEGSRLEPEARVERIIGLLPSRITRIGIGEGCRPPCLVNSVSSVHASVHGVVQS
jgi:hypothetical protein